MARNRSKAQDTNWWMVHLLMQLEVTSHFKLDCQGRLWRIWQLLKMGTLFCISPFGKWSILLFSLVAKCEKFGSVADSMKYYSELCYAPELIHWLPWWQAAIESVWRDPLWRTQIAVQLESITQNREACDRYRVIAFRSSYLDGQYSVHLTCSEIDSLTSTVSYSKDVIPVSWKFLYVKVACATLHSSRVKF